MSHGQIREGEQVSSALDRANGEWARMMREGRSFSGRERNCFFLNTGSHPEAQLRFANMSSISHADFPEDGRAIALTDWDGDGDQDVWLYSRTAPRLRLLRNDQPTANQFLQLKLQGNGTTSNRDAIGARVQVFLSGENEEDSPPLIRTVRAGEGFLAQSTRWLHFGLGDRPSIERVVVRWPDGETETWSGISPGTSWLLVQGQAEPKQLPRKTNDLALEPRPQERLPKTQVARVPLIDLLSVPDNAYNGFDGREYRLMDRRGMPMLVVFWSSTCPHCRKELEHLKQRYSELQQRGVEVIALSINRVEGDKDGIRKAEELVAAEAYPFIVGEATPQITAEFQVLHNLQIAIHRPMPIPSSFLIDSYGRLSVIYKGPVAVDQVIADLDHATKDAQERFVSAALMPGRFLDHPRVKEMALKKAVRLPYQFGTTLLEMGRPDLAVQQFSDTVKLKPDFAEAYYNLGVALRLINQGDRAIEAFRRAVEIDPKFAEAHNALGEMLGAMGRLDEAIACFEKAVEADPDFAPGKENLEKARAIKRQL